jgi:NAD(P)-dependent dehydrogenase (short-subunit alcohol dehydrogenase family)
MSLESTSRDFLGKFNLTGKVALVTGGSRGIGRSIALAMAEVGADIILVSRKLPDLEGVAEEIKQKGRRSLAIPANMRNLPEIEALVKKATGEFGRIDILVNNAASNPAFGSVFTIDEKLWDTVMGLNLKGYFFLSQAIGRLMRQHGGGSIINVTSESGMRPALGLGIYSISKAGAIMLTQVLAQEWGQHNIRVNSLAPGLTRTKFAEVQWSDPQRLSDIENNLALGRISEPDDMAGAALFLASEASRQVTGQNIVVDGGFYASVQSLLKILPE